MTFSNCHPAVPALWFILVLGFTMTTFHPVLLGVALLTCWLWWGRLGERPGGGRLLPLLVLAAYPESDLSGDPSGWFSDLTLTASGRVAQVKVGGVALSGGAVRNLFGLRSACFQVEYGESGFTFSVTGYGHGVGMSQYGANAMAQAGSTWQEIIAHYYTGVTLQLGE